MAPLRGWSLCGRRLDAKVPFGHWKTMTFIGALRHDLIDAPWVIDGPVNADIFQRYVETQLIPARHDISRNVIRVWIENIRSALSMRTPLRLTFFKATRRGLRRLNGLSANRRSNLSF